MTRFLPLLFAISACHPGGPRRDPLPTPTPLNGGPDDVGVLVMAHGGGPEWDRAVAEAVSPLSSAVPTAISYGMADPETLSTGLDSLAARGVTRVAVVRLFISGSSFRDQTFYFLGLSQNPPRRFVLMDGSGDSEPKPLDHGLTIATHDEGLMVSPHASRILVERAKSLSSAPERESVLILAHGMGDDREDGLVLSAMTSTAQRMGALGFSAVQVATLREDWEAKRETSEREIRDFVSGEAMAGRHTLVLPMRLSGFGPYAEVLDGLEYKPGLGLLPHQEVAAWIRATATRVVCEAGWGQAIDPCPRSVAHDFDQRR